MRRIVINPEICNGQPTFEGTRITVQTVLELLGAGDSPGDIVRQYPSLMYAFNSRVKTEGAEGAKVSG